MVAYFRITDETKMDFHTNIIECEGKCRRREMARITGRLKLLNCIEAAGCNAFVELSSYRLAYFDHSQKKYCIQ